MKESKKVDDARKKIECIKHSSPPQMKEGEKLASPPQMASISSKGFKVQDIDIGMKQQKPLSIEQEMKLLSRQEANRDKNQVKNGVTGFDEKLNKIEAQKEESKNPAEIKCIKPQYMIKQYPTIQESAADEASSSQKEEK